MTTLLATMLRFDARELAMLLQKLDEAKAYAEKMCGGGNRNTILPENILKDYVTPVVVLARKHARQVELNSTLDRVAEDTGYFHVALTEALARTKGLTFQDLQYQTSVLRESIEADLEKRQFLFISSEKAKIMDEMSAHWSKVWEKLPNCKADTEEAVHCYCLERNTASVFHSMRVSEHGLRNVAKKVGVKLTDKGKPQPIEYATWDKVINGIKSKIAAAHSLPQGPRKSRRLQFYSDAAENCSFIRDIWRNEVSHTRKTYGEAEALRVLNRVRDFMLLMVDAPK